MHTLELARLKEALASVNRDVALLRERASRAYPLGSTVRVAHMRNGTIYLNEATVIGVQLDYSRISGVYVMIHVRNVLSGKERTVYPGDNYDGVPSVELLSVPVLLADAPSEEG